MSTATKPRRKSKTSKQTAPTAIVTIAMFDDSYGVPVYRPLRDGQPVSEFEPLTSRDYSPRGGTPLHDATAKFIAHLEQQRRAGTVVIGALADESGSMNGNRASVVDGINEFVGGMADVEVDPDTDGKVLAVILTDGMENASKEVGHRDVANLIREKEAEGWTFIYLGANQDTWAVGGQLGATRSVAFTSSPMGTRSALRNAGAQASSYLSNNASYSVMASSLQNTSVAEDGTVTNQSGAQVEETDSLAARLARAGER